MALDDGSSSESYISTKKAKEVVEVLKEYTRSVSESEEGKKSQGLECVESSKVILEIDVKKIPSNKTTFVNVIGPLPHPFKYETETVEICLLVKDPNPKKGLKDRELDLENSRELYRERLVDAGLRDDFMNRLSIMPLRELFTEYREYEAKNKLSKAFDVFLADKRAMKNKFSTLKTFLGTHFWQSEKKIPIPVDLSLQGEELKTEFLSKLASTSLFVSGNGSTFPVVIGLLHQPVHSLANNLVHVLRRVKDIFGKNVSVLKIQSRTCDPIPFFVDLESPNEVDEKELCPKTRLREKVKPAVGEVSLFDDVIVTVSGPGKFVVAEKKNKRVKIDDGHEEDEQRMDAENDTLTTNGETVGEKKDKMVETVGEKKDKMVERIKSSWIEKTRVKKRKEGKRFRPSESLAAGRRPRRRQLIETKTG